LEKCNFRKFRSPVTLTFTLTLDRVIRHTIVHQSSTSIYIPNFIEIEKKTVDGRTYLLTDISPSRPNVIRSTRRSLPKNSPRSRFCTDHAQNLPGPAAESARNLSKSVHFRRSYKAERVNTVETRDNKVFPIFSRSLDSSRITSCNLAKS